MTGTQRPGRRALALTAGVVLAGVLAVPAAAAADDSPPSTAASSTTTTTTEASTTTTTEATTSTTAPQANFREVTLAPGESFTLSGKGCLLGTEKTPGTVTVVLITEDRDGKPVSWRLRNEAKAGADGSYSVTNVVPNLNHAFYVAVAVCYTPGDEANAVVLDEFLLIRVKGVAPKPGEKPPSRSEVAAQAKAKARSKGPNPVKASPRFTG
jgi:hypothetical protein